MAPHASTETPLEEAARAALEQGYEKIMEGLRKLGYASDGDENFVGTATRSASGFANLIVSRERRDAEIIALLNKTFPAKYSEMVISKHNVAFGCCPHHLLPVLYRISVAYIPRERVLGISKLSRMAKLLARAPILQEDLTHDLAQILHERLHSEGAAVYIEGLHLCMASRGIQAHEARVVTSAMAGVFLSQPETRTEFVKLVTAAHPPLV